MAKPDERLQALSSEATSLLELAKQYREKMRGLDPNDPVRKELETVIKDLLERANSASEAVKRSVRKA